MVLILLTAAPSKKESNAKMQRFKERRKGIEIPALPLRLALPLGAFALKFSLVADPKKKYLPEWSERHTGGGSPLPETAFAFRPGPRIQAALSVVCLLAAKRLRYVFRAEAAKKAF
jgi:hypothetical protein